MVGVDLTIRLTGRMDMTVALLLSAPFYLGIGAQNVQISTCDCARACFSWQGRLDNVRPRTKDQREDAAMTVRKARWAGIVVAAMMAAVLLPGSSIAQSKLTPVRAAYVPVATWLPAWVALDKGIFAKHGLDVTFTPIQNLSLLPGTVGRQF